MNKKLHTYIIILTLGLFLLPSLTYACGTQSEKGCCKKETASTTEKKDCCDKSRSSDENDNCNGKCGHANCTSVTANYSSVVFNEFDFTHNTFDFSTIKQNFYNTTTFVSSGYTSIWLIPKIS